MRIMPFLLLGLALFVVPSQGAQAAVSYTFLTSEQQIDISPLSVGDEGTAATHDGLIAPLEVDLPFTKPSGIGTFIGSIPSMSKITFTYNAIYSLTDAPCSLSSCGGQTNWISSAYISTNYSDEVNSAATGNETISGWVDYNNFYNNDDDTHQDYFNSGFSGAETLLLVTSFFPDDSHAVIELTNLSELQAYFRTFLVTDGSGSGYVNYAMSAVPLPAALPLFGLGIAGLAGYRRFKSKSKAL